jgi:import inner membrane translocase subunit TIM22
MKNAILAGAGGAVLGAVLGGFMHSMQPVDHMYLANNPNLTTWEQVKIGYRGIGAACGRHGRMFSKIGVLFATLECLLERRRGGRDIPNGMYSGCIAGAMLSFSSGPSNAALGCVGFAAFSGAMERMMHNM